MVVEVRVFVTASLAFALLTVAQDAFLAKHNGSSQQNSATTITTTTTGVSHHYLSEPWAVGGWGGICTCPDGSTYEVGDNMNSCESLACESGIPGPCSSGGISPINAGMKVTCNADLEHRYYKDFSVGGWGGICACPDGSQFEVGDNGDSCGSLACVGGVSGGCSNGGISAIAAGMKVVCMTPTPAPTPAPEPAPSWLIAASGTCGNLARNSQDELQFRFYTNRSMIFTDAPMHIATEIEAEQQALSLTDEAWDHKNIALLLPDGSGSWAISVFEVLDHSQCWDLSSCVFYRGRVANSTDNFPSLPLVTLASSLDIDFTSAPEASCQMFVDTTIHRFSLRAPAPCPAGQFCPTPVSHWSCHAPGRSAVKGCVESDAYIGEYKDDENHAGYRRVSYHSTERAGEAIHCEKGYAVFEFCARGQTIDKCHELPLRTFLPDKHAHHAITCAAHMTSTSPARPVAAYSLADPLLECEQDEYVTGVCFSSRGSPANCQVPGSSVLAYQVIYCTQSYYATRSPKAVCPFTNDNVDMQDSPQATCIDSFATNDVPVDPTVKMFCNKACPGWEHDDLSCGAKTNTELMEKCANFYTRGSSAITSVCATADPDLSVRCRCLGSSQLRSEGALTPNLQIVSSDNLQVNYGRDANGMNVGYQRFDGISSGACQLKVNMWQTGRGLIRYAAYDNGPRSCHTFLAYFPNSKNWHTKNIDGAWYIQDVEPVYLGVRCG